MRWYVCMRAQIFFIHKFHHSEDNNAKSESTIKKATEMQAFKVIYQVIGYRESDT